MKKSFVEWKPSSDSLSRLKQISTIVDQYSDEGITMTLRQLFYQLVSKDIIPNKQREYKNLGNLLSKARLAGLIDWDAIEDRARKAVVWQYFDSIEQCVKEAADQFNLQRWSTQDEYVELWCEKDALSSVIEPICSELFATFMVNRGYSSSSAMYDARNRIIRKANNRPTTIIYLGDFDPSGEDMVRDIRDRMATFRVPNLDVVKLALNLDQVKKWKLPPNPAKMSDSRASKFVDEHGNESYEVDAIPPKDLQKMIENAIMEHMDMDKYQEVIDRENELKAKLKKAVAGIK